jgi:hypothetical protein
MSHYEFNLKDINTNIKNFSCSNCNKNFSEMVTEIKNNDQKIYKDNEYVNKFLKLTKHYEINKDLILDIAVREKFI